MLVFDSLFRLLCISYWCYVFDCFDGFGCGGCLFSFVIYYFVVGVDKLFVWVFRCFVG